MYYYNPTEASNRSENIMKKLSVNFEGRLQRLPECSLHEIVSKLEGDAFIKASKEKKKKLAKSLAKY